MKPKISRKKNEDGYKDVKMDGEVVGYVLKVDTQKAAAKKAADIYEQAEED